MIAPLSTLLMGPKESPSKVCEECGAKCDELDVTETIGHCPRCKQYVAAVWEQELETKRVASGAVS